MTRPGLFSVLAAITINWQASVASAQSVTPPSPRPVGQIVTIMVAGDTGYSPNHATVHHRGVTRHGRFQSWRQTTERIAAIINGDLNFLNVETVVTASNRLTRDLKGQRGPFNFRTHPNGIRHLVDVGFNVMSLANNHSMDYGAAGLRDTLRYMDGMRRHGLLAAAGIGLNREQASRPHVLQVKGADVAFSAIGIVTNNLARHRAGKNKAGQIAYRFDDDFALSVRRLAATPSSYRILSIHYGLEGRVRTDQRQIREWRRQAALGAGIDLIIGHHAHVPRAVEIAGHSVIFYGLGNFLHHGTANMSGKGVCKDFGLLGKLYLLRQPNGRLRVRAVEVTPVGQTHWRPEPLPPRAAQVRLHALNYLAAQLGHGDDQSKGMRFSGRSNGRGLYCFPGAERDPGEIGRLCRNWRRPARIPSSLRGRIAQSCAR
ncbi:MAG: CapA family protein [Hyphomicrobiaceae bacterium]